MRRPRQRSAGRRRQRVSSNGEIPFSRAAAKLRVGPDWLDRARWSDAERTHVGLLDSIHDLSSPEFDSHGVHPAVRAFYEDTLHYDLRMRANARTWARLPLRLYGLFARFVGQTEFPRDGARLSNRFVAIDRDVDHPGRRGARAWVRTHGHAGRRVLYVILVSWHETGACRYMHTAVPLPGGNIASLMRMTTIPGGGVRHETIEPKGKHGPAGVYFAYRRGAVRLPLTERIDVWPASSPAVPAGLRTYGGAAHVLARHVFRLFGAVILTLDYAFEREPEGGAGMRRVRGMS